MRIILRRFKVVGCVVRSRVLAEAIERQIVGRELGKLQLDIMTNPGQWRRPW
jgi:hypothetical protein